MSEAITPQTAAHPFRWEIRSATPHSGEIFATGEAPSQEDATRSAGEALAKHLHRYPVAVVCRTEEQDGRTWSVPVETLRGPTFGRPVLAAGEAYSVAREIFYRARALDEAAVNWNVTRQCDQVRLGIINYGASRQPTKGPEEVLEAEQRFYAALEALRAVMLATE